MKKGWLSNASRLDELAPRLHNTNGGVRDTELNEFTVKPTGEPSGERVVTTVMPVAKVAKASRNASGETSEGTGAGCRMAATVMEIPPLTLSLAA